MTNLTIQTIKSLSKFQLFALLVFVANFLTLTVVSIFSLLFHEKITYDYIITGIATGLVVSAGSLTIIFRLLEYLRSLEKQIQSDNQNRQEERYKTLYEKTPIMLHSINTKGELISVSDYWLMKLGYSREEVIGKKSVDFLTDVSRKYASEIVIPDFNQKGYCLDIEYQFVKKSGDIIDTLLSATSECDSNGKIIRSLAVIIDITERKQAEERARDISKLLESVVDNIPNFVFVKNSSDLRFVLFNRSAEKFLGRNRKDLIGKNDFDIFEEEQALKLTEKDRQVLAKPGEIDSHEEQINTKLGKRILKTKKLAILDEEGNAKYLLGITEDITEEKLAEAELRIVKEDATAANTSKSQFLTNMGHELRTPLNGVIGFSDLLLRTNLDEMQSQYTKTILRSANSLLQILNDILSASTLEENELDLHIEKTHLIDLVNQASDVIRFAAMEKKLNIIINFQPNIPMFIWVDPVRLKQIFLNLLSNAVKYTKQGEIEIKVEVTEYNPQTEEAEILFIVRDTGIGISKDDYGKIFEIFAQLDASNNRRYGGAGLGLTISKRLLALMQSNLEVESEPGKGSKFYFTIKTKVEYGTHTEQILSEEKLVLPSTLHTNAFRVLLVDDDIINMFLGKTIIKNILPNATIFEAENGKEAVEQFLKVNPNIIFMDIQMPEMNGYEAAHEIRKKEETSNRIPIIAITAGTKEGDKEKCLKSGMDDYTRKPVIKDTIEQLIHKWLLIRTSEHHELETHLD